MVQTVAFSSPVCERVVGQDETLWTYGFSCVDVQRECDRIVGICRRRLIFRDDLRLNGNPGVLLQQAVGGIIIRIIRHAVLVPVQLHNRIQPLQGEGIFCHGSAVYHSIVVIAIIAF